MPSEKKAIPGPKPMFGREILRNSLLTAAIGLAIAAVISFAAPPSWSRPVIFLFSVLIAVLTNFVEHVLDGLYRRWIIRHRKEPNRLVLSLVYFLGGVLGFGLASWIVIGLSLIPSSFLGPRIPFFVGMSGAVAIVVGLLISTYERMRERLGESVARLKEAEFAEKELELARSIQRRLLPPTEMEGEGYRLSARNLAARFVAGDFYDAFHLADGSLGVVVADVAGKGIGASLIMASVKAVLPLIAADRSVVEALEEVNRKLVAELAPREYVALAYVRFDPKTGGFTLGNAGLPDPYLLPLAGGARALSVPGPRLPLGIRRDLRYEVLRGRLEAGEKLLLLTDGLPEAPTATGDPLGYERFESLLDSRGPSPDGDLDRLLERVSAATRPGLEDDWTVVLLERRASPD